MSEHWLDLTDIPAEGREYIVDDQTIWTDAWKEFHMELAPKSPLSATFSVTPEDRGFLVRGRLEGAVEVPCDRCTRTVDIPVGQDFELFEEEAHPGEEVVEPGLLRRRGRVLELDVAGMLWEEFVLALPVKPLCSEECKGLCPSCGKDLSEGPCACEGSEPDPRMAALRGLTIAKKD